jgi:hypothetical protein
LLSKKENKKNERENEKPRDLKLLADTAKKGKDKINMTPQSRFIGKGKRLQLFQDANYQCEYISPSTGRRCDCQSDLEVDHLYPYAWGGSHDLSNTRILCRSHNFFYSEQTFVKEKMTSFRRL